MTERPKLAAERGERIVERYPHCDPLVLHAPGECEYCDSPQAHPLHGERNTLRVRYTGWFIDGWWRCPSEERRDLATIEKWPGNRATNVDHRIETSIRKSRSRYDDLDALLKKTLKAHDDMKPLDRIRCGAEQRISWVYGNLAASTMHRVSLRQVRRAALELWLDRLCSPDHETQYAAAAKLFNRLIHMLGDHDDAWRLFRGH